MATTSSPEDRFWPKVSKGESCWLFTGGTKNLGYGLFWLEGKMVLAHRFSWELVNGQIPDGLCVLHQCDTRNCVRPDHLYLGTMADNCRDRDSRGRYTVLRGEANGRSRLTNEDVHLIRARYENGESSRKLGHEFGVSKTLVLRIAKRQTWAHI